MEYERNMSVLRRMITFRYTLTPTPTKKLACRGVFLTKAYIDRGRHHENIWKMGGGGGGGETGGNRVLAGQTRSMSS